MTYPGVCKNNCVLLANNCLSGIFDREYIQKNVRAFDQIYQQNMKVENDFDERYFVNQSGLIHTPIKLISPLQYPKANTQTQAPQFSERQDIINTANNKRHKGD